MISISLVCGILAAVVLAAGCEVEGPAFKASAPPTTRSVIYVYRPYRLMGSIDEPAITCGEDTVSIGAGGYHTFVEEPGTVKCYAGTARNSAIAIDTRPGAAYFVREVVTSDVRTTSVALTSVDRATGQEEIGSTRTPQ